MSLHMSRTVAVLKKMSRQELDELQDYVDSNFSKATKNIKATLEFLISCAPDFKRSKCSKEQLSQMLFKRQIAKKLDKEINRLMSELLVLIQEYIVIKTALSNNNVKFNALTAWYVSRNLKPHLKKVLKETENTILNDPDADQLELYDKYLINIINLFINERNTLQTYLAERHHLEFLKVYNQIRLLITETGMVNTEKVLDNMALVELEMKGKRRPFLSLSFKEELKFYQSEFNFLLKPSLKEYSFLKNCLLKKTLRINNADRINLTVILDNNLRKLFSGVKYHEEAVQLSNLKAQLELELNGFLHPITYRNFLLDLCSFGRVEEAIKFQKTVGSSINGLANVENHIKIYYGYILFTQNEFSEALNTISKCTSEFFLQGSDIRELKTKLAYKMGDNVLFDAHVNGIRKFLSTKFGKSVNTSFKKNLLAMVRYTKQLFKVKSSDKNALLNLKRQVENNKDFHSKLWILNEIDYKLKL